MNDSEHEHEHLLVRRGNGIEVWHYPSDADGSTPACCHGRADAAYKQLRPGIARDWFEQCATCAGERSFNGGQGETSLPTTTEVSGGE
jgi:hypothetical protein